MPDPQTSNLHYRLYIEKNALELTYCLSFYDSSSRSSGGGALARLYIGCLVHKVYSFVPFLWSVIMFFSLPASAQQTHRRPVWLGLAGFGLLL